VLDKDLVNKILADLDKLDKLMNPYVKELIEIMQTIDEPKTPARQKLTEKRINELVDELSILFEEFSILAATQAYRDGRKFANEILEIERLVKTTTGDKKAIKALIKDMNMDFDTKIKSFQRRTSQVMHAFSKQGALTESEISLLVAQGYIDKNTAMGAKKVLRARISETGEILDESELAAWIERKLKRKKTEINKRNVNQAVRDRLYAAEVERLKDGKFMQIIDKNGDIRTYKVDTYADLVSRTRLGEAQVLGTIEEANEYNIDTFRVSDHNTTTKKCQEFEGKTFTTDPNNKKFPLLTEQTRPLYHVNCQHRLLPYKITSTKLKEMANVR